MGLTDFLLVQVMLMIIFVLVISVLILTLVKGISTWNKNNHSPRLCVKATIVSKRSDVSHHMHGNAGDMSGVHDFHSSSSTRYFVTFQVESGDRMELSMSGSEFGMLAEGDVGELTFQGSRYLGFERVPYI